MTKSKSSGPTYALLIAIIYTGLLSFVDSHSFLIYPRTYDKVFKTHVDGKCEDALDAEGNKGICDQACPTYPSRSADSYLAEETNVTWMRGEEYVLNWARNNHEGGFISISILPIDKMQSKEEQRKYSVYQGCWQQGKFMCGEGTECGKDRTQMAYSGRLRIPKVISDGLYALTMVWYGGLTMSTNFSYFSDYHSCAFIRIAGGELDATGGYQPIFVANEDSPSSKPGKCKAGLDDSGLCLGEECREESKIPSSYTVPKPFQGENKPDMLRYSDYTDEPPPVSYTPTPSPSPIRLDQPFNNDPWAYCTWKEGTCCLESCGQCGDHPSFTPCEARRGGRNNCCVDVIENEDRICGRDPPPCVQV